jgi:serine protease Do
MVDHAGLKSGDVITEVDGQAVVRSGELSSLIGLASPGERVKLKVWRDRTPRDIEAKLGGVEEAGKQVADAGSGVQGGQLGVALRPLTTIVRSCSCGVCGNSRGPA